MEPAVADMLFPAALPMNEAIGVVNSQKDPSPRVTTTTTISTIAVKAEPHTTIVIAMLKSLGFVDLRIDEMQPNVLEIGNTTEESRQLLVVHNDLVKRLASKQPEVESLLAKADQLVSEQHEQNDILVYEAMAESLGASWKELNRRLALRGYILFDMHHLHQLADEHAERVKEINVLLRETSTLCEQVNNSGLADARANLAAVVSAIDTSFDELITITSVGVDLGSQLISQIKVLGSLADSEERPREIADACLRVEKLMLEMAQQWGFIDACWTGSERRAALQRLAGSQPQTTTKEAILEPMARTEASGGAGEDNSGDLHQRISLFLSNANSAILQMEQMREDLCSAANASMAGELAPLAHRKVSALVAEGQQLLLVAGVQEGEEEKEIRTKLELLRSKLEELVELAHERINSTKASNERLREKLVASIRWLESTVESELKRLGSTLGPVVSERARRESLPDTPSAHSFLAAHKRLSAEVIGREPEIVSLFTHASDLPSHDRKELASFRQRFETTRKVLEERLQVGRLFEQTSNLARELNTAFARIISLLSSTDARERAAVEMEINSLHQSIRELLQQERHQGEKFIVEAERIANRDPDIIVQDSIDSVQGILVMHEQQLMEITRRRLEKDRQKTLGQGLDEERIAPTSTTQDTRVEEAFVASEEQESGETPIVAIVGKPIFVEPLSATPAVVAEGETAVLDCVIVGEPEPQVVWYKEGEGVVKESERLRLHFRGDHCSLSVAEAGREDAGLYIVKAINLHGESTSFCRLNIASPKGERKPRPAQPAAQQFAEHNEHNINGVKEESMNFPHSPTFSPPPPPVPLHRYEGVEGRFEETHASAAATGAVAAAADSHGYTNGDAGYSSLANAPQFIKPLQAEYTVVEGEKVRLDALMVGNPRPRVQWYFNGQPVRSDRMLGFVEVFLNVGDTYSIQFSPASIEHAGSYRLVVENVRGRCECTTLIRVVHPHKQKERQQHQRHQHNSSQPQRARRHLRELNGVERQKVFDEFRSSAGYPLISTSPPAQGEKQLDSAAPVANGNAPHFTRTLVSCVCSEGDEVKFEAALATNPVDGWPQVSWSKDGVELKEGRSGGPSHIEFVTELGEKMGKDKTGLAKIALVLHGAHPTDGGKYMCTAKNAFGVASSSAQLVLRVSSEAPDFVRRLVSEELAEGERLQWWVEVSGNPSPAVSWLRNGEPIPDNCEGVRMLRHEREGGEQTGINVYSLLIERVEHVDAGEFTCVAENPAGEARTTADLVVRPVRAEPGAYYHITKVVQERQVRGEELTRSQTLSIEPHPPPT